MRARALLWSRCRRAGGAAGGGDSDLSGDASRWTLAGAAAAPGSGLTAPPRRRCRGESGTRAWEGACSAPWAAPRAAGSAGPLAASCSSSLSVSVRSMNSVAMVRG